MMLSARLNYRKGLNFSDPLRNKEMQNGSNISMCSRPDHIDIKKLQTVMSG